MTRATGWTHSEIHSSFHWAIMTWATERTDSELSHWAIMTRATGWTESEIHSFSHWATWLTDRPTGYRWEFCFMLTLSRQNHVFKWFRGGENVVVGQIARSKMPQCEYHDAALRLAAVGPFQNKNDQLLFSIDKHRLMNSPQWIIDSELDSMNLWLLLSGCWLPIWTILDRGNPTGDNKLMSECPVEKTMFKVSLLWYDFSKDRNCIVKCATQNHHTDKSTEDINTRKSIFP